MSLKQTLSRGASMAPAGRATAAANGSHFNLVNDVGSIGASITLRHDTLQFSEITQEAARFVRPTSVMISNAIPSEDHDLTYQVLKRGADIALAALSIVLFAPLIATIAILIGVTYPGPIFFRQERLGAGGKVFGCLKFRTMVRDAEKVLREDPELMARFTADFKIKNDPRITPVGNYLRRSSLDELPQLFNILAGDMSFIGPRPIIPPEIEKYGAYGEKLLSVKPGLGGIWQACGRSVISYDERIALDMIYVDSCSVKTDVQLMWMTASSVFRKSDAF